MSYSMNVYLRILAVRCNRLGPTLLPLNLMRALIGVSVEDWFAKQQAVICETPGKVGVLNLQTGVNSVL